MPQDSRVFFNPTTGQFERAGDPDAPEPILGQPSSAVAPPEPRFSGKELMADLLQGGSTAASFVPGLSSLKLLPTALRTLGQAGAGAGQAALRGEDPLEGAAFEGGLEATGAGLGRYAPKAGLHLGSWMGAKFPESADISAFLRQRERRGIGRGIPLGSPGKADAALVKKGQDMGRIEREYDAANPPPTNVGEIFGGVEAKLKGGADTDQLPEDFKAALGGAQRDTLQQQVRHRNPQAMAYLDPLLQSSNPKLRELGEKWTLAAAHKTPMTAENAGEVSRNLKKRGEGVITKKAEGTRVPPHEKLTQEQVPATIAKDADSVLDSLISGRADTRQDYADLMRIRDFGEKTRSSPFKISVRSGVGAAAGGAAGFPLGASQQGAMLGGMLGAAMSPKRVSQSGFAMGRAGQALPPAERLYALIMELLNDDNKAPQ